LYPEIHLTSEFSLPTYLVTVSLTYCLGLLWLVRRAAHKDMDRATALDIAFAVMVGGFLGARLFHVFYELPEYYMARPIEIFKFWNGGFCFLWRSLSRFCLRICLGKVEETERKSMGRSLCSRGCFLLRTRPYWLSSEWVLLRKTLRSPLEYQRPPPRSCLCNSFGIWHFGNSTFFRTKVFQFTQKKWLSLHQPGRLFVLWMGLHGISRLFLESVRADDRGPALFLDLSISSLISFVFVGFAVVVFLKDFILNMRSSSISI
jgi:phosphatidylglycerol:prolipoprotein diacylglycerol transferase